MRPVLALTTGVVAIVCGLTIFAALLVVAIGDQHDYTQCRAEQAASEAAAAARGDRAVVIARVAARVENRWLLDVERAEEGPIPSRQWAEGSCGLELAPWRHYRIVLAPGVKEPAVVAADPLGVAWPSGLQSFSSLNPTARYAVCAVIPFLIAIVITATTLRRHPAS